MSENRCPCCGALLWQQAIEPVSHYECTVCPFQCTPADLPRNARRDGLGGVMTIDDRLIQDQDFYVRVQKTKLVLIIIGLIVCYFTGALEVFNG